MPAETESKYKIAAQDCRCHEIETEPLFEWIPPDDGLPKPEGWEPKSVTIYCPKYFEVHVALDYLDVVKTQGSNQALRWAAIRALGEKGWEMLRSPGLDYELFVDIMSDVIGRIVDGLSGPKGR